ncbi:MAG: HAD family hydrolase [Alphaproteobacteria bacterium]
MQVILPKPKAIIFDWDNTLVNTWPIIHDALTATFLAVGKEPWTFEQTCQRVRKSMRDSFPEVFGENWQAAGDIYQKQYKSTHLDKLQALSRAEEVLSRIRDLALFCTVVSNKKGGTLRQEIEKLGWGDYFDSIVGSDDAARDKPHADPVQLAFKDTGIMPAPDVWFVGDSEIDLECALNTGCTAILYGELAREHPEYTATHFQGFPYHAHVHGHTEMLDLLDAFCHSRERGSLASK